MIRFGLDSTSMVPVAAHHAVGSTVACRYLGHDTSKVVSGAEHRAYKAGGIDLFLVFEDAGRPDLKDYAGGKANAEFALNQALGRLGRPARPFRCTFAWDDDPTGHASAADDYFEGVAAVFGRDRSGPYGGLAAIRHLADRGFRTLWQTYAWSGGQWDQRAEVRQYNNDHVVGGVGVDFDHILPGADGDFGQVDFVPHVLDPHHYERFDKAQRTHLPRPWLTDNTEVAVVKLYDTYREQQTRLKHPHRAELAILRHQLTWLAWLVRHNARSTTPSNWGVYYRGVPAGGRYHQLTMRAAGERVNSW